MSIDSHMPKALILTMLSVTLTWTMESTVFTNGLSELKNDTSGIVRYLKSHQSESNLGKCILISLTSAQVSPTAKAIATRHIRFAPDRLSLPYVDYLANDLISPDLKLDILMASPQEAWLKDGELIEVLALGERNPQLRAGIVEFISSLPNSEKWLTEELRKKMAKALTLWGLEALKATPNHGDAATIAAAMAKFDINGWPEITLRILRSERTATREAKNSDDYVASPVLLTTLAEKLRKIGFVTKGEELVGDNPLMNAEVGRYETWWEKASGPSWFHINKALERQGGD